MTASAPLLLERFNIVAMTGPKQDRARPLRRMLLPLVPAGPLRSTGDQHLVLGPLVRAQPEFASVVGRKPEHVVTRHRRMDVPADARSRVRRSFKRRIEDLEELDLRRPIRKVLAPGQVPHPNSSDSFPE